MRKLAEDNDALVVIQRTYTQATGHVERYYPDVPRTLEYWLNHHDEFRSCPTCYDAETQAIITAFYQTHPEAVTNVR